MQRMWLRTIVLGVIACFLTPTWSGVSADDRTEGIKENNKKARKKYGDIFVGSPQVVTRERLVNDRLEQDKWLRQKLAASDSAEFGNQGLVDIRTLVGLVGEVGVSADANLGSIYDAQTQAFLANLARDEQSAELQHRLEMIGKLQELRSARSTAITADVEGDGTGDDSGGDSGEGGGDTEEPAAAEEEASSGSPEQPEGLLIDPANARFDAFLGRLENFDKSLAKPTPEKTNVIGTPIDTLRDHIAYREEIRNEIFENQLDDRHDLKGHALYRLNVDTTVLPSDTDIEAWAVVEVDVESKKLDGRFYEDLYDEWRDELERELNILFLTRRTQAQGCEDPRPESGCKLAHSTKLDLIRHALACIYGNGDGFECFSKRIEGFSFTKIFEELGSKYELIQARSVLGGYEAASGLSEIELDQTIAALAAVMGNALIDWEKANKVKREDRLSDVEWKYSKRRLALDLLLLAQLRGEVYEQGLDDYLRIEPINPWGKPFPLRFDKQHRCIAKFETKLKGLEDVHSYAATPKESVQRISEVASHRSSVELTAALSVLSGGVGMKGALSYIRQSQELLNGLFRQPLVVGFTGSDALDEELDDAAQMGWIIGPKFRIRDKTPVLWRFQKKGYQYAHSPIQNALAGSVVVPGWWNEAKVTVRRRWVSPSGKRVAFADKSFDIRLPRRLSWVTDALASRRDPILYSFDDHDVVHGQPASLLIAGENLWRSTRVTLGAQSTQEIQILPNMSGIVASFTRITEPTEVDGKKRKVPVRVWTSDGVARVGNAVVHPPKKPEILEISTIRRRLIANQSFKLQITRGELPPGLFKLEAGIREKNKSGAFERVAIPVPAKGTLAEIDVKFLGSLAGLASGDELEVGLFITMRQTATFPERVALLKSSVVFYKTADDAKIKISPASIKVGSKIKATFPKNIRKAFPGFSGKDDVKLKIASIDPSTVKLKLKDGGTLTGSESGGLVFEATVEEDGKNLTKEKPATVKLALIKAVKDLSFVKDTFEVKKE